MSEIARYFKLRNEMIVKQVEEGCGSSDYKIVQGSITLLHHDETDYPIGGAYGEDFDVVQELGVVSEDKGISYSEDGMTWILDKETAEKETSFCYRII